MLTTSLPAPALLYPALDEDKGRGLDEFLDAHGIPLSTENELGSLMDWAAGRCQGTLLLQGKAFAEDLSADHLAVIRAFQDAGWHVLGLTPDVDPGGAVAERLLRGGVDDVCVAVAPWSVLLRRLTTIRTSRHDHSAHELLRRAVELAPCGLTITDASQRDNPIVYANQGFQRITGYSPAEILGRNCRFLQRNQSRQLAVGRLRQAVADGQGCHVTLINFRKDGRPFHNELALTPLRDGAGNLTAFVGIQNDVSARVEAIRALQESEERFRTLANLLPTRVWFVNSEGAFEFLNEAWNDFLAPGATPDAGGWLQWVHPEDRESVARVMEQARSSLRPMKCEARLVRPSGEARWFIVEGVPRLGAGGKCLGLLGSAVDVTDNRVSHDQMWHRMWQLSMQTLILRKLVGGENASLEAEKLVAMLGEMADATSLSLLSFPPGNDEGKLKELVRWESEENTRPISLFADRRLSEVIPLSARAIMESIEPVSIGADELPPFAGSSGIRALVIAPIRRGGCAVGALAAVGAREGSDWEKDCMELMRGIGPVLAELLEAADSAAP